MNQRYALRRGRPGRHAGAGLHRDPELYYQATTWPGARLPHVWLEHQGQKLSSSNAGAQGEKVSTHDLAGKGRFALFTGIGGDGWANAAAEVSADLGIEIAAYVIGPGREVLDTYDDWAARPRSQRKRLRACAPRYARGLAQPLFGGESARRARWGDGNAARSRCPREAALGAPASLTPG